MGSDIPLNCIWLDDGRWGGGVMGCEWYVELGGGGGYWSVGCNEFGRVWGNGIGPVTRCWLDTMMYLEGGGGFNPCLQSTSLKQ
jgi:hypothetical protein